MRSAPPHNRAETPRFRAARLLRLRRTAAFALALCALWTMTAALPVAAAVRALRPAVAAAAPSEVLAEPEPEAVPAAACSCVTCSAGAHGGGALEAACCCVPVLGEADDAAATRRVLSALCDEGAPDAVLASVSWCPPAVLPSPSAIAAGHAPRLALIVAPSPADAVAPPAPDRARPETPPRPS